MNRSRKAAVASLFLLPVLAGGFALQARASRNGAQLLQQVMSLVSGRYVDTVGSDALYEKAARGLVKEMGDPYTELFTPKQMTDFARTTNGSYAGVGMEISLLNGWVTVGRVFPGTPAERGGVLQGDRIAKIDTSNTKGWKTEEVQNLLLGKPGTKLTVSFQRPGVELPITQNFIRAVVHIPAVPYAIMLNDRVGYIPLIRFSQNTAAEIDSSVKVLKGRGAKGIVLDLRGNGGGILEEAFAMSNLFLPQGKELLSVRGRGADNVEKYIANEQPTAPDVPLVVLVDGGTASASEIVAGALQDYDRALVLGTTSFGKGLVQSVYNLDGGYALKLTTGKWFTPSGRSIQKPRKLMPDGSFVEVQPDSLETDSARKARPVFKSSSGRTVYGGGAITPDVVVPGDTLSTPEQRLAAAVRPKFTEFYTTVLSFAIDQKGKVKPDFTVQPAWRDEMFKRLEAAGVKVDRALYDNGISWVDRYVEDRVAQASFGDSTARRHSMGEDTQLQRAMALLQKGTTQREVFAAAAVPVPATPKRGSF